jgi:large subunit ribosomal protein L4
MELKTNTGAAVAVSDATFGREFNEALVHQIVTAYMAGGRQGTKAQKTRSEVSGGGIKPWRQKGTGRARAGSASVSQYRGGGVVHGPVVRSYAHSLQKKVRNLGMRSVLSAKMAAGSLIIVDEMKCSGKTSELRAQLAKLGAENALMIAGEQVDEGFGRAASNLPFIDVLPQQGANVYDMLRRDVLVLSRDAAAYLEERLK